MSASHIPRSASAVVLAAAMSAVGAEELPGQSLQFHGFASQGFVLSEGNNVNGTSQDSSGSARFQEFGVNGSWRPHADVLVAGQFASFRAGNAEDEYLILEYGLVDYAPFHGESGRAGARVGKIKLPIGFYNDSRDAVFTRPSIFLPESVYLGNSGARSFGYFAADGGALYADLYAGEHALYIEAGGYGGQDLGDTADVAILRADARGRFGVDDGLLLRVSDDYDGGRVRAAVSILSTTLRYHASGEPFSLSNIFAQSGDFDFEQLVLSLQYNLPRFSLTGEYAWRKFELDELIPPNPFGASTEIELEPAGAYLQGTWRFSPKWSAFLRHDQQFRDANDRNGAEQSQRFNLPRHYFFAFDSTVGTRYDVTEQLAVWSEFHYVDGVAWVNPLDNPGFSSGGAERYWNLLALMVGYRF